MNHSHRFLLLVAALLATGLPASASVNKARNAVVKIFVTSQPENYILPWQPVRPRQGTGTGFVINKKHILTNAHVVSNARHIELQKSNDARRYTARVAYAGHDCDLAVLEVKDPSFFDGTDTLKISDTIPQLDNEVTVVGFPMGGARISLTRGVVSRIDFSSYSHSGVDEHLVLQVDAAINPGNSGGPVLFKNKVIGVAFQGLTSGDNIGYAIPTPVIRHFLDDIEDGKYNGYPELGVFHLPLQNEGLRANHGFGPKQTGVLSYYIDPFGAAKGHLREGDILMSIDGHDIANDASVSLDGNQVIFAELLERKQWGDEIHMDIWRDKEEIEVRIPLTSPTDPFHFRNVYDERPEYLIVGGLVFAPMSREHLKWLARRATPKALQNLLYFSRYAKQDQLAGERTEFLLLVNRLPHKINSYHERFLHNLVSTVNGKSVNDLAGMKAALSESTDGFHIIDFETAADTLVLDASIEKETSEEIRRTYGVTTPYFIRKENK